MKWLNRVADSGGAGGTRPRWRYFCAIGLSLAATGAHVFVSTSRGHGVSTLDQIIAIVAAVFGMVTSLMLMWDIIHYSDDDLGKLRNDRRTMILALFTMFVASPYGIWLTFERIPAAVAVRPAGAPRAS